jgi:hypothetical protein
MELRINLDDAARHGDDAARSMDVPNAQLGELAPPQARVDERLDDKPRPRRRE